MGGGSSNGPSAGAVMSAGVPQGGGYKRGADDFETNAYDPQDAFKRPRPNGYPGVPSSVEVDAYRRQHEVSAVVCNRIILNVVCFPLGEE